jgi:hypothetical protein
MVVEIRTAIDESESGDKFVCPNCGYEGEVAELGGEFDCPLYGAN